MSTHRETAARSAISSIASERGESFASTDKRPTGKQTYRAFYLLLEIAGIPAPQTAREASELIVHLTGQRDALRASDTATDTIPF